MKNDSNIAYILASGSPRRKELLTYLNLDYTYQYVVETDEIIDRDWTPAEAVMQLSTQKAAAVWGDLSNFPYSIEPNIKRMSIIAADTIVVQDGNILGKPKDKVDAFNMLSSLQGRAHEVYTGLTLFSMPNTLAMLDDIQNHPSSSIKTELHHHILDRSKLIPFGEVGYFTHFSPSHNLDLSIQYGYIRSKVTFRPLSADDMHAYIATNDPMDKAGAYGIQGVGAANIESISGDFYSVMGLPISLLSSFIRNDASMMG